MSERVPDRKIWRRRTGVTLASIAGLVLLGGAVTVIEDGSGSGEPTATPLERPQRNSLNQAAKDAASRALKRYVTADNSGCPSEATCYKDTNNGVLEYREESTAPTPQGESSLFIHQTMKANTTPKGGVELDIEFTNTSGITDTPGVYTQETIKAASQHEQELVLVNPVGSTLTTTLTPEAVRAFLIDPDTTVKKVKTDPNVTVQVNPDGIDLEYAAAYSDQRPQGAAVMPFVMKQVTRFADEVQ